MKTKYWSAFAAYVHFYCLYHKKKCELRCSTIFLPQSMEVRSSGSSFFNNLVYIHKCGRLYISIHNFKTFFTLLISYEADLDCETRFLGHESCEGSGSQEPSHVVWRTATSCRRQMHFLYPRRFTEKAKEKICNFALKLYFYFGIKTRL